MKGSKGITLIALVITIIVMLILVAVTITMAVNGGLFTYAGRAKGETKNAINAEQELANLPANMTTDELIAKYTSGGGAGGVTWILTDDADDSGTITVGDVYTIAGTNESFYVIKTPEETDTTVKLLAAKCVDTREEVDGVANANYNKQSDVLYTVAFDEGEWDFFTETYVRADGTFCTNEYANATIKGLVDSYFRSLGLEGGGLMSYNEATSLQTGHTDILYGDPEIWSYWLGSPREDLEDSVWTVYGGLSGYGGSSGLYASGAGGNNGYGLRPVIEISISSISLAQHTTGQGGATLTWTHTDANSNNTFDVGEVVTASDGKSVSESFYVIESPANGIVKLLTVKCVNTSTWTQGDDYNTVAFDAGIWDTNQEKFYKPGTTTPVTNVYANASIKGLVKYYVTNKLKLNENQGRLMLKTEAEALQTGHTDELYGTTTKWNFWLGSPREDDADYAWSVSGAHSCFYVYLAGGAYTCGLRPVIEIATSSIS